MNRWHLAPTTAILLMSSAVLMAGCSNSSTSDASPPASLSPSEPSTPTLPPLTPCPTPTASTAQFPSGASARLPHPDFATEAADVPVTVKGVHLLKFTTAMSLRDAVIFVTDRYPRAGYVIGDGDAEGHEADVPFSRGKLHGKLRLAEVGACTTTWLVATVTRPGADLDDVPGLGDH